MKKVVAILSAAMMVTVAGCGAKGNEQGTDNAENASSERKGAVTEYMGNDFCEEIPSVYYNLIDEAPIIDHMNFTGILRDISSRTEFTTPQDEKAAILLENLENKVGEPTFFGYNNSRLFQYPMYSTAFDNVCVGFQCVDLGPCLLDFVIVPVEYEENDGGGETVWTPDGDVIKYYSGRFDLTSYENFALEDLQVVYGKNMISAEMLHNDYSGMTYAQIAEELGSTGFLNAIEIREKDEDSFGTTTILASWYCAEEDAMLSLQVKYTMTDIESKESYKEYYAEYEEVEDSVQHVMFHEKTAMSVEDRCNFNPLEGRKAGEHTWEMNVR
ncbi:MAG: hypothetical protein MJ105_09305 [Lachnospiraceae bacterium]|nr:hypothetical protein [Lachnospiraceae bacterium]